MTESRRVYDLPPPPAIRGVGLVIVLAIWEVVCVLTLVVGPTTRPFKTLEYVWWLSAAVLLPVACFAVVQLRDGRLRRFRSRLSGDRQIPSWLFRSGRVTSSGVASTSPSGRTLASGVLLVDPHGQVEVWEVDTESPQSTFQQGELVSATSDDDRFGHACLRLEFADTTMIEFAAIHGDARDLFGFSRGRIAGVSRILSEPRK